MPSSFAVVSDAPPANALGVDLRLLDWSQLTADEDLLWIYDNTGMRTWVADLGLAAWLPDCFRSRRQTIALPGEAAELHERTVWRRDGPCEQPPRTERDDWTFGQWAERNAHILDRPAAVAASLAIKGTVAHRGAISPEAIVHWPTSRAA
jgi:hypothetical protein